MAISPSENLYKRGGMEGLRGGGHEMDEGMGQRREEGREGKSVWD